MSNLKASCLDEETGGKPAVCVTLTSPFVLNAFLQGHLTVLSRKFRVVVCVNIHESTVPARVPPGVECRHVEIRRAISPLHDIAAFLSLLRIYRELRCIAVISVTPKGGLLGMVAARIGGVPLRVHWFTGQVWATKSGIARWVLKQADMLMAKSATYALADSASQRDFLASEQIAKPENIDVIGDGSISGVDLEKFQPNEPTRRAIRGALCIPALSLCFVYVGRLKREKGVVELLEAFAALYAVNANVRLLLVGPDEEGLADGIKCDGVIRIDYTQQVEQYMAAGDIICLPSHREGFGSVLIEAAAMGVPAVASRIYGISDAVVDGETGLLHEPGNVADLIRCLRKVAYDPQLRSQLGQRAHDRARRLFSAQRVEKLFGEWMARRVDAQQDLTI